MKKISLIAVLLGLSAAARAQTAAVPVGLTNIGVAAAVRGAVRATPPGQSIGRVIGSGQPVYLNDHVTTGPDGRLQLLLLDQTTFTIGPNSDMVLDEFVYDPHTGVGTVSAQILKGFFRFVTGKVAQAKPSSMKVRTPVGTIGIRGTMVVGHVDGGDAEIVLIGPGYENNANERRGGITVFNAHGSTDIDSSGYGVRIRDGGAPGRGFRVSPVEMETILGALAPKYASGHGGPPDASRASGDGVAQGGINYHSWSNLNAINTTFNQTTSLASQVAAGCTGSVNCWSDLQAIPSGTAGYSGSGNAVCAGGGCATDSFGPSGTFNYGVNVDFAARTIGGGASSLNVTGSDFGGGGTLGTISFSALKGPAVYTVTNADDSGFAGTQLSFLKSGGVAAGAMQVNLVFTTPSGGVVTGTSQAPKGAVLLIQ